MKSNIQIKRAYVEADAADGERYLVDRLWPRGVKKEDLHIKAWIKEAGPSTELRKWFGHDPERWDGFQTRYLQELKDNKEVLQPIREAMHRGKVTLVYSAHDEEHNQAVVLCRYLSKLGPLDSAK